MDFPKISHSMRQAYKSCPRKVHYRWVGGIRRRWQESPARAIGKAFHRGIEMWRNGHGETKSMSQARSILQESLKLISSKDLVVDIELTKLDAYLSGYFKRYPADIKRQWTESEMKLEHNGEIGFIDTVYEQDGLLWIVDDKTSAMKPHADLGQALQMDEQLLSYICMLQDIGYTRIGGCIYRVMVKNKSKPKKKEKDDEFYERMQLEYATGERYHEFVIPFDAQRTDNYRREKAALNKSLHSFLRGGILLDNVPRNSAECLGKYGSCDYLTLCTGCEPSPKLFEPTGNLPMDGGYLRNSLNPRSKQHDSTTRLHSPDSPEAQSLPGPTFRGSVNAPVWDAGNGEKHTGSELPEFPLSGD